MRTYSKGNRQKVALVAALATDAELLILDEPTSGLDPLMEEVFQQVIAERSAEGATVLLSSHILSEVETLCQRVTVIRSGRAVFSGGLDELRAGAPTAVEAVTARPPAGLEGIDGVSHLHRGDEPRGARTTLLVTAGALSPVVAAVSAADPKALTVRPPSLEEIFLDHYNGDRDDAPSTAGERVAGGE